MVYPKAVIVLEPELVTELELEKMQYLTRQTRDSFRRTICFGVRPVSAYDPFQHAIRFGAQFVSVRNSFRRAFRSVRISFGAHFVSPYIITSASKQASNYSEESHLVCFVSPAAFRVW